MKTIKCIVCGSKFEAIRCSKLCCSADCEKMRKANYDIDRYEKFRNANRKKRREMLAERYSIESSNLYKIKAVCDECLTEFYYDYSIYQKFNNTFVSSFNTTEWGAACCPRCGLVEKSKCDEVVEEVPTMSQREQKIWRAQLSKSKIPILKHQAIYIRNHIDFIAEAEDVRKRLNRLFPKGDLTQDEINICITALFKSLQ